MPNFFNFIANPFKWAGSSTTEKGSKAPRQSVMANSMAVQVHRLRQDVGKWRDSLERAENVYYPDRTQLLNIYADLALDLHLSSVLEKRKINVLSKAFKVVKAGQEDEQLTRLLKKPWLREFMSLALESITYGHSLIEFGQLQADGLFKSVELVPRQYVSPELGIVRSMPGMITGIEYRDNPLYSGWLIEVGKPSDLGLLNKAAPMVLWKKNVLSAWADFTEIFGMPYRSVSTDATGADLEDIEGALAGMGQAAYGIFPEDTKIEFIASGTSNERLYDTFIERANSEISKLILGQTMTTDAGSSRAQGEVHERVAASYTTADAEMLLGILNEQLLPFLIQHGYDLKGCELEWDEAESLGKKEQFLIVQGVMQNSGYKVSKAYLQATFGVEFEEAEEAEAPGQATEARPILGYHIEAGIASRNEARAQLLLPEEDESEATAQRKLKAQLSIMQAATSAGLPVAAALKLSGLKLELPAEPAPEQEGAAAAELPKK